MTTPTSTVADTRAPRIKLPTLTTTESLWRKMVCAAVMTSAAAFSSLTSTVTLCKTGALSIGGSTTLNQESATVTLTPSPACGGGSSEAETDTEP